MKRKVSFREPLGLPAQKDHPLQQAAGRRRGQHMICAYTRDRVRRGPFYLRDLPNKLAPFEGKGQSGGRESSLGACLCTPGVCEGTNRLIAEHCGSTVLCYEAEGIARRAKGKKNMNVHST